MMVVASMAALPDSRPATESGLVVVISCVFDLNHLRQTQLLGLNSETQLHDVREQPVKLNIRPTR